MKCNLNYDGWGYSGLSCSREPTRFFAVYTTSGNPYIIFGRCPDHHSLANMPVFWHYEEVSADEFEVLQVMIS
jgi:hypothetical protein